MFWEEILDEILETFTFIVVLAAFVPALTLPTFTLLRFELSSSSGAAEVLLFFMGPLGCC